LAYLEARYKPEGLAYLEARYLKPDDSCGIYRGKPKAEALGYQPAATPYRGLMVKESMAPANSDLSG